MTQPITVTSVPTIIERNIDGDEGGRTAVILRVVIPESAKIISVRGLMHNEPWGGAQHPPKDNTDDLGSTDNHPCPMGNGDCPIAWASVSEYSVAPIPGGQKQVFATFENWAGRNDRTGTLEVTYSME